VLGPVSKRRDALPQTIPDLPGRSRWQSEGQTAQHPGRDGKAAAGQICLFFPGEGHLWEGRLHGFSFRTTAALITRQGGNLGTLHIAFAQARSSRDSGLDRRRVRVLGDLAADLMQARLDLRKATAAVAEKDLLAREADHRVANGLQLLQSALVLQARLTEHAAAQSALQTAARRVSAVARAHRHIHQAPARYLVEGSADAAAYLRALLNDVGQQPGTDDGPGAWGRSVTLRTDPDAAAAVPASLLPRLGLVAAELVANALKHGAGPIVVALQRVAGTGSVALSVVDEGPGFPADFVPAARDGKGLGMRLVAALAGPDGVWIDPANRRRIVVHLGDQARR
jgi:two-component sensor histidine kinase